MLYFALVDHCEFNSIYNSINMFVKLVVLACVAVASAQWNGGHNNGGWNGGNNGGWNGGNNGGWNGGNDGAWNGHNNVENGEYTGDGDYHGEGLQEAGAFGDVSQNWNDNNGQWNGGDNNGQWNGHNDGQWNGDHNAGQWNNGNNGNNGAWNGGNNGAWNGGNNGAWNGGHAAAPALLPAGVDAHSCPNYPYCH